MTRGASLLLLPLASLACGPKVVEAPETNGDHDSRVEALALPVDPDRCTDAKAQLRPFVLDWDGTDRGELEALAQGESLAVVKMSGCNIELLPRCQVQGAYRFRETTPQRQQLVMKDAAEIYANVPFVVGALEGKLGQSDSLSLEYVLRGIQYATRPTVYEAELGEGCDDATHFVLNYAAGAFSLSSSSASILGGGADMGPASAGGEVSSGSGALLAAGDMEACPSPEACSAPLRLRLVPISPGEVPAEVAAITSAELKPGETPHTLEPDEVRTILTSAAYTMGGCVHEFPHTGPVEGTIEVACTVEADGVVKKVDAVPEGAVDEKFVDCIEDAFYSLRFPRSDKAEDVKIPYVFRLSE